MIEFERMLLECSKYNTPTLSLSILPATIRVPYDLKHQPLQTNDEHYEAHTSIRRAGAVRFVLPNILYCLI